MGEHFRWFSVVDNRVVSQCKWSCLPDPFDFCKISFRSLGTPKRAFRPSLESLVTQLLWRDNCDDEEIIPEGGLQSHVFAQAVQTVDGHVL